MAGAVRLGAEKHKFEKIPRPLGIGAGPADADHRTTESAGGRIVRIKSGKGHHGDFAGEVGGEFTEVIDFPIGRADGADIAAVEILGPFDAG